MKNAASPTRRPNDAPGLPSTRTINKDDGGGKKEGGSGRGKRTDHPAAHRDGEKGGAASASRSPMDRSDFAKKAAVTRKRNAEHGATS